METCDPFDLVVVPLPFTDRESAKRRPALVLSGADFHADTGHLVLAMVTTAARSSWHSDVTVRDWRAAGLPHPSVVRMKIFTLDGRFILRKLGSLTARDRKQATASLAGVLTAIQ